MNKCGESDEFGISLLFGLLGSSHLPVSIYSATTTQQTSHGSKNY